MNANYTPSDRLAGNELQRVIEPLANYICATDRPRSALRSALSALFREVQATNGAAAHHFHSLLAAR